VAVPFRPREEPSRVRVSRACWVRRSRAGYWRWRSWGSSSGRARGGRWTREARAGRSFSVGGLFFSGGPSGGLAPMFSFHSGGTGSHSPGSRRFVAHSWFCLFVGEKRRTLDSIRCEEQSHLGEKPRGVQPVHTDGR
jgi:hypothetical protein